MNFDTIIDQAEQVSGSKLQEPLKEILKKILIAVDNNVMNSKIKEEIDFLKRLRASISMGNVVSIAQVNGRLILRIDELENKLRSNAYENTRAI